MAGAGISTPSGIQDFRTAGTGLYYNLQKYNLPYPEAIFDIGFFHENPRPFFEFAKELMPGKYVPNPAHFLPVLFLQKRKLLRMYTQNIDGLEKLAGLPEAKLVEAHGTFATATCVCCGACYSLEDIKAAVYKSEVPLCHQHGCKGVIKPDIVFFGEDLPYRFYKFAEDTYRAQALIVMGTSLEVMPFASVAEEVSYDTPRLLINKELAGYFGSRKKDVVIIGDVVAGVTTGRQTRLDRRVQTTVQNSDAATEIIWQLFTSRVYAVLL